MLQHLNTLIGFAAVFAILSLLVTSVTQVIRTVGKLKTRTLIERLLRLFGELEDPERFAAAVLAHPTLEGGRGKEHYAALTNPSLNRSAVQRHVAAVLGRGCAASRFTWLRPWPRTDDLDKQAIKDIGQSVYEAIGYLVDRPVPEPTAGSTAPHRWAWQLKETLDHADEVHLTALSEAQRSDQAARPSPGPQLQSAVVPFRGRMWMLAASAFPEADGKVPPLKTYVAAFHDEAQASASDSFTWRIRWVTVAVSALLAFALQLDAIRVWQRMAKADPAQLQRIQQAATSLQTGVATNPTAGVQAESPTVDPRSDVAKAAGQIVGAVEALEGAGFELQGPSLSFTWLTGTAPIGFLLALAALSLGAPFWFEVLKSAIQMKSAFTKEKAG